MQLVVPQVSSPLKVWERIEIVVGEGPLAGRYVARIEDFTGEGIIISNPELIGGGTLLRENIEVVVLVTREDAVYQFYSRIRKIKTHIQKTHLLTLPKDARRVQRRQFVRIERFARITYANLTVDKKEASDSERITWRGASMVNVSGGGILMKVKGVVSVDDLLLLKISFFNKIGLPDPIAGICRRTFHRERKFFAGIEFLRSEQLYHHFNKEEMNSLPRSVMDFDQFAQSKLVTDIFQEQIEMRKKGLL